MPLVRRAVASRAAHALWMALVFANGGCSEKPLPLPLEPQLEVDPPEIDFGGAPVGTEPERVVLLRNIGNGLLELEALVLVDDAPRPFAFEYDRRAVPPNGAAAVTVRFRPREEGLSQALLQIQVVGYPEQSRLLTLRGTGLPAAPLEFDPHLVDFARVRRGTVAARQIEVRNPHNVALQVPLVLGPETQVCGATSDPTPFCIGQRDGRLSAERGLRLDPEETLVVDAYFGPTELRPVRGHFSFGGPCATPGCGVNLDGVGVDEGLRCAPERLDFGAVNPGRCAEHIVVCENVANLPAQLLGWRPSAAPPTPSSFSFAASSTVTLEPGETFELSAQFCPTALGELSGRLEITTDVPTQPLMPIELAGRGGGPDIEVRPESCDFGRAALVAPARCRVTVHNRGSDPLHVSSVDADTAGTGAFFAPSVGAVAIPTGERETFEVHFHPVAVGAVQSTLRILTNDRGQPELDVPLRGEGVDLPSCDFTITPASVDLGLVPLMHAHRGAIELRNLGAHDCLLTGVSLAPDSDPAFTLDPSGARAGDVIAARASALIPVDYRPQSLGPHRGEIAFDISSSERTFNRVVLTGTSTDAAVLVAPRDLDFGVRGLGCRSAARPVRVYNPGPEPVVLEAITQPTPSSAFVVVGPQGGLPSTIAPGDFAELSVTFFAQTASAYAGRADLLVTVDGQPARYAVWSTGRGAQTPVHSDRFVQMPSSQVDVLFAVAYSGSMGQEQTLLADHFTDFVRLARGQGVDYSIGVVSDRYHQGGRLFHGDRIRGRPFAGPFENRLVTPGMPNAATVFALNVQAQLLAADHIEHLLFASYLALSPANLLGPNRGLLRPDAALSVVFLTDRPELGYPYTLIHAPSDPDFYEDFLRSTKPRRMRDRVSISAIAGDVPDGCSGAGGNAAGAPRLRDLAERTGGRFASICSVDWGAMLGDLSRPVFGLRTRFPLSNAPTPGTIMVEVDGVLTPPVSAQGAERWRHEPVANTIDFSPLFVPEPGAQITVVYTPACH